MQEMKWGVVKKWKWGVFFCKKKWTFPQRRVRYVQYRYFLFYILLIWGVRTHPPCLRACYSFAPAIRHPYYRHTAR